MSRNAVAAELQRLMEKIDALAVQGANLADSSGGMVSSLWFRAAQNSMRMAAGDLDSKGLLSGPAGERKAA